MKLLKCLGLTINSFISIIYGYTKYVISPKNLNNSYYLAKLFSKNTLKILGINLELQGRVENLKLDRPVVYIANHQNNFDFVIGCALIKKNAVSMGKQELRDIPFFGFLYEKMGNILVNRNNPKIAIRQLDVAVKKITQNKTSVWIFPEGKRNPTNELIPFKRGALIAAFKSGAPILPIAIERYSNKPEFKNMEKCSIKIKVLDLIETKDLTSVDQRRLMNDIRVMMEDEIRTL